MIMFYLNHLPLTSQFFPSPSFNCFLSTITKLKDPTHFKEAVKYSYWVEAMNKDLEALEINDT